MLTAWARLPTEVITKSFKSFALNLAVDGSQLPRPQGFSLTIFKGKALGTRLGSQDSEIHCFHERPAMRSRSRAVEAQLSVLDEPTLPDPFQAITNSDIEEAGDENTMVLDEDSDVDIEL